MAFDRQFWTGAGVAVTVIVAGANVLPVLLLRASPSETAQPVITVAPASVARVSERVATPPAQAEPPKLVAQKNAEQLPLAAAQPAETQAAPAKPADPKSAEGTP